MYRVRIASLEVSASIVNSSKETLERLPYRAEIAFPHHVHWQIAARQASTRVRLEARERIELALTVQPSDAEAPRLNWKRNSRCLGVSVAARK